MKIHFIIFIFLILFLRSGITVTYSQDFDDFRGLKCSGPIPDEFLQRASEKFLSEKKTLSKNEKRSDRKRKHQFLLESNFIMEELLFGGKVLFNDPVSEYVNHVADILLKDDAALRKKLRFYTIKSTAVNSFATNSGVIFVNVGLVAQLENEAQLAYVLSHEITHYVKNHVINQYVETEKIKEGKGIYKRASYENKLISKCIYSKELEEEADDEGYKLFSKTEYDPEQIPRVFDILLYSYLPFDLIEFKKSFFETKNLIFPDSYFLTDVSPIKAEEEYDDTKSDHPNVFKRKQQAKKLIEKSTKTKGKSFIYSKDEFLKIRKMCRYELSRIYLLAANYEKAIYNSYLLLQSDKNNSFLLKTIAKGLYGLVMFTKDDKKNEVHYDYTTLEGDHQQLIYLLDKLKPNELNVLALVYCWNLRKKLGEDPEIKAMLKDMFTSLFLRYYDSKDDFFTEAKEEKKEPIQKKTEKDAQALSKLDKISSKKKIAEAEGEETFIKYAFVDLFKDAEFNKVFGLYMKRTPKNTEENKSEISYAEFSRQKAKERKDKRKGYALGVDKLVCVNPVYSVIDQRKDKPVKYIAAESAKLDFKNKLKTNAQLVNLDLKLLDPDALQKSDVDAFNDMALLYDWLRERVSHETIEMQYPFMKDVNELTKKYGTDVFSWFGFVSVREKKEGKFWTLIGCIILYPALPWGLYYAFVPEYNTYFYTLVFDVTQGKTLITQVNTIDSKDRNDVLNSHLYDRLLQIKYKRDKKN